MYRERGCPVTNHPAKALRGKAALRHLSRFTGGVGQSWPLAAAAAINRSYPHYPQVFHNRGSWRISGSVHRAGYPSDRASGAPKNRYPATLAAMGPASKSGRVQGCG
ncbi:hypothetical protein ARTHRO9AX_10157 [Arthrobacter sp. 9AX]|nr:hypothetical protein ARTHRO9AX_10157 [Arthrobacter sp. 9AX]